MNETYRDISEYSSIFAASVINDAVKQIDYELGKGWLKEHPEVLVAALETAATALHARVIAKAISEAAERIQTAAEQLSSR